jgi:hypothetical protein
MERAASGERLARQHRARAYEQLQVGIMWGHEGDDRLVRAGDGLGAEISHPASPQGVGCGMRFSNRCMLICLHGSRVLQWGRTKRRAGNLRRALQVAFGGW